MSRIFARIVDKILPFISTGDIPYAFSNWSRCSPKYGNAIAITTRKVLMKPGSGYVSMSCSLGESYICCQVRRNSSWWKISMNQCTRSKYVSTSSDATSCEGNKETSSAVSDRDTGSPGPGAHSLSRVPVGRELRAPELSERRLWPPGNALVIDVFGVVVL